MFSTSLAAAALSGLLASGSVPTTPSWQTDYRTALQLSAAHQKPLVVVIHNGGASQLFKDSAVSKDVLATLRQSYVGLSVDPTTPEGRQLAETFKMQEGVVISDKTGAVMALRYEGEVAVPKVQPYLTRYAGMVQAPSQTEYVYQSMGRPQSGYHPVYGQQYQAYQPVQQPGIFQQPGPINNLITRPVTNVFNATRNLVIGGG
jgi:hypothetical protein